jgi:hypothetical protein
MYRGSFVSCFLRRDAALVAVPDFSAVCNRRTSTRSESTYKDTVSTLMRECCVLNQPATIAPFSHCEYMWLTLRER